MTTNQPHRLELELEIGCMPDGWGPRKAGEPAHPGGWWAFASCLDAEGSEHGFTAAGLGSPWEAVAVAVESLLDWLSIGGDRYPFQCLMCGRWFVAKLDERADYCSRCQKN